jgi:hypothetical protein
MLLQRCCVRTTGEQLQLQDRLARCYASCVCDHCWGVRWSAGLVLPHLSKQLSSGSNPTYLYVYHSYLSINAIQCPTVALSQQAVCVYGWGVDVEALRGIPLSNADLSKGRPAAEIVTG